MKLPKDLEHRIQDSIRYFWQTREKQHKQQEESGKTDQGSRSAVTGGKQMDGFVELIKSLALINGIQDSEIFTNKSLELPGFFRPTKKWDLLVVADNHLVAALELKSQIGPSFGNNFNNRTEEAMGSALDIWTAFRKGAFGDSIAPWLGYLMLLEDCPQSKCRVAVQEPHFKVFDEYRDASYAKRYELFCRKLVLERHYSASCFLMSKQSEGSTGSYEHPANDLTFTRLITSFLGHINAFVANRHSG